MRFLVVGAGATGGYFGARLAQAGRDVTFLVREGRAAVLRERGLRITGLGQDQRIEPQLVAAGQLGGPFDVVVVTVKAAGLPAAIADLAPAVGPDTAIIPFLNGMAHLDALTAAFGADKVLGSVVKVLATLDDDGGIRQLGPLAEWSVGELHGGPTDRVRRILAGIDVPGYTARAVPDALAAMWHKWVFIATAGVVTCLMRGPVGDVVSVPGGTEFVYAALAEAVAVSTEAGFPVPDPVTAEALAFLAQPGSAFTSSLYRDMTAGLPNEAEHILGDFARRAHVLGLEVPLLDLALMQLRVHEAGRL
ncbi:ketopantoate reductase family protein [Arthrobacter sp. STN4]|uniref:ketopantoate reductase family protein n=1 Tax=Arthrobacter sp. STN4 TaxID=2923276 RepID=UPI00211A43D8|nr:ketopantoate reductase family protein [Arthrobacter sp. STN4]MCQ9162846.1 ketopantoate reductase family protein [Arthrobacter sp. STN4]